MVPAIHAVRASDVLLGQSSQEIISMGQGFLSKLDIWIKFVPHLYLKQPHFDPQ